MDSPNAPTSVTQAPRSRLDLTGQLDYRALVEEEKSHYSHIEVTAALQEGGANTSKAWNHWFRYLEEKLWHTGPVQEARDFCNSLRTPRILSLGCGYGGNEINIASKLRVPYELVAVDFNDRLFEKARREIRSRGLDIRFCCADLNFIEIRPESFDLVFALGSLHHVLNLEHLFHQVWRGLKRDGRFILMDLIGETRTLFWRENVEFAAEAVRRLPPGYAPPGVGTDGIIPPYAPPGRPHSMEGIRQGEIEEELGSWFDPVKVFRYGAFMRLICLNPLLAPALDPDVPEARRVLEDLFRTDLERVREGRLRPTEMYAVLRKRSATRVAGRHLRGLARALGNAGRRRHIPVAIKELMLLTGMVS